MRAPARQTSDLARRRMSRTPHNLAAIILAAAWSATIGCSSSGSSVGNIDVIVPQTAAAPPCPSDDAGTSSACWAIGRLVTSTGCADAHCVQDGGLLMNTPDYGSCNIVAPDPASSAPASSLAGSTGALSIDDGLCEFRAVVVPECASASSLIFDVDFSTMTGAAVPAGAKPYAEAYLTVTHLTPDPGTSTEGPTGHYRIGPVVFDMSGHWNVTLHFFGTCNDALPGSPHAHVNFTLDVP